MDAVFGKLTDGQDTGIDMATIAVLDSGNNVIAVCTSDSAGCFFCCYNSFAYIFIGFMHRLQALQMDD